MTCVCLSAFWLAVAAGPSEAVNLLAQDLSGLKDIFFANVQVGPPTTYHLRPTHHPPPSQSVQPQALDDDAGTSPRI